MCDDGFAHERPKVRKYEYFLILCSDEQVQSDEKVWSDEQAESLKQVQSIEQVKCLE